MKPRKKIALIILAFSFFLCISCGQNTHPDKLNTEKYTEHFINGKSIKLHYLDWGGSGQPLILIHGLGDSPYLFEDLANTLSQHFRVIAYSRRGHCKTICTDSSYDTRALASDLKLLVDSLNISKTNLLGWSMSGNEITEFAIRFPERTNKLIYLESGYDFSEEPFKTMLKTIPVSPFANSHELASIDLYRKWYHDFWFSDMDWNQTLEKNLLGSIQINHDSSITPLPEDAIAKMILQSGMSYQRKYENISAPALVLYTKYFFNPHGNDSTKAGFVNLEKDVIHPWREQNMNRIRKEYRNAILRTVEKGSHTSLIFLNKDSIIKEVNHFLFE